MAALETSTLRMDMPKPTDGVMSHPQGVGKERTLFLRRNRPQRYGVALGAYHRQE